MKTPLLLLLLMLLFFNENFAQKTLPIKWETANNKPKFTADYAFPGTGLVDHKKFRKLRGAFPSTMGTKEHTGNTSYDLQSNGSMQRRILTAGNTVSVGWTLSGEINATPTSPYNDRGTGYAHFNGTSWTPAPATRIEPMRTGFCSMAIDGNGDEIAIVHDASNNLVMNRKTAGSWTTSALTTSAVPQGIWPHIATSGNWLYILTSSIDSNSHSNGIRFGYFFSRSSDNGATWIDNMIPMPMVDSIGHYRGGGNSYAISARGNKVAVLCGDIGTDLTLLTSVDNGATWTKKVIWDWPLDNFNFAGSDMTDVNLDMTPDTLESNDGSQSMVMDANGDIHLAFPLVRVYKPGGTTGYSFFYSTYMLYYNSIVDSLTVVDNTFFALHDCDDDGLFGIGAAYAGSDATKPGAIYNSIGTLTMPSISIVSGNPQKVLLAYTAIMDNDTTVDDGIHPFWYGSSFLEGQNYRDVLVAVSPDNGNTWNPFPVNVSRTAHFEEAFVSTPEIITGNDLNLLYQGDIEPGTIMQNEDSYDDFFKNLIIVQNVSISSIVTLSLDSTAPCGQGELPLGVKTVLNGADGMVQLYPNPADDYTHVNMKFIQAAQNVTLELIDFSGKVLQQYSYKNISEYTAHIPTLGLPQGLYLIKINADDKMLTRKFLKE